MDREESKANVEIYVSPEELLRGLAVAVPTALSYARKGRLLWVSEALSHMFGYESVAGVVGMHAREFYHSQEEYERVREIVGASLKQGRPAELAARFKRRDGTSFSGYLRATGLLRGGQNRGVISTIGDASAQDEKGTTDSEPEDTYRGLFTLSPDAIVVSSREGTILEANPAFLGLFGYDPAEIREIHAKSLWANPDERDSWQEQMERDGYAKEFKAKLMTKNGRVKVCLLTSAVRLDRYGEVSYQAICRDVTERERAEKALSESNERLQALLNAATDAAMLTDREGRYLSANRRLAERFGMTVDEIVGKSTFELVPADLAARRRVYHDEALRSGKSVTFEDTRSGIVLSNGLFPVFDSEGRVSAIAAFSRDITEQRRAELALRASEERYRAFVANSTEGIWRFELDQPVSTTLSVEEQIEQMLQRAYLAECNDATARMYGFERAEELIGLRWKDVAGNDARNIDCLRALIQAGYRLVDVVTWETDRAGNVHCFLNSMDGVVENGHIIQAWGVQRDVTEQKRAEEALKLSEVTYREIFNSVNDTIWIHDIETFKFLDVNNKVEEMFGYSVREALDLSVEEISSGVPPFIRETAVELLRKAAAGEPQLFDWHSRQKDGRLFWTEVSLKRGIIAGKECLLAIERDITDRKLGEAEREKLQEQLLHAQKMDSVGRLAGGVAHDFNNLLSAILGHVELAMMRCAPSNPMHARLNVIKESALRSADLVRQLLAFARRQTVAPKVLDVNVTVADMLKMLLRVMGEDIDLVWMPGATLWPVKMDPSQIDQILVNLCVNARDAIAGVGKVTIETENTFIDDAYCAVHPGFIRGEYVMLGVSDDGCGMSKEVLEHIFEPFFTTKAVGTGTGLGLATVYGIVKQNEGFINVYSEPGRGTTFKIYLPRFAGEVMGSTAEIMPETPTGSGEIVLLVEDEVVILNLGREMLEQLGYKVLTAKTPSEALHQAREHADDIRLLITDVIMPEMNGRDLAKLISDIKPGLKCLFASGYTANVIAHHGVLDEGVQFLQKPFSLHELGAEVRKALDRE